MSAYDQGVTVANLIIDSWGGAGTDRLITWGEEAADAAFKDSNQSSYDRSRGFLDTVREYQAARSDI